MSRPLPVRISKRAAGQIEKVAEWWRERRTAAPHAVEDELERAFFLLSIQPEIGSRALNDRLAGVRRLYLSHIRYHLYYIATRQEVTVLAMWHTSRGSDPDV